MIKHDTTWLVISLASHVAGMVSGALIVIAFGG